MKMEAIGLATTLNGEQYVTEMYRAAFLVACDVAELCQSGKGRAVCVLGFKRHIPDFLQLFTEQGSRGWVEQSSDFCPVISSVGPPAPPNTGVCEKLPLSTLLFPPPCFSAGPLCRGGVAKADWQQRLGTRRTWCWIPGHAG